MADSGKQSPLGVNVLSTLLSNQGLQINPVFESYVGTSHTVGSLVSLGSVCNNTCLRLLTYSINDAYVRGKVDPTTYENLITIGAGTVPALGNSKPPTFTWDKSANPGDPTTAQTFSWNPYDLTNPDVPDITSWGYVRLLALQGWNEFNYNNGQTELRDYISSYMTASSFVDYSNPAIMAVQNSKTFLDGTYSNMNDLMSADITGVNMATPAFGLDLINLGKAIDLSTIDSFGLPSKLLLTLQKYNAITASVTLALLSTNLTTDEISYILSNTGTPTSLQEYSIYQALTIIGHQDLLDIMVPLNCKTQGLTTLADLLNIKMMFPGSYMSMTVPIYNTTSSNVNSKIYYPIYIGTSINANLTSAALLSAIGTVVPSSLSAIVTSVTTSEFTPQEPDIGFGSYLQNILPPDVAVAAGAFSAAMLQIRNIQSVPIEKFAQSVVNLETTTGLSVNGSSVPVDIALANYAAGKIALGSGPQGTYTMSNFFGCMSGLPYNVARIQEIMSWIRDVPGESAFGGDSLYDIYKNLYLKVTWEQATVDVTYTTYIVESPPTVFTTWYHVTGFALTDPGGGYGFGGAPSPSISIDNGGSGTTTIGIDKNNISTFGRVVTTTLSSAGADATSIPVATVAFPPGGVSFSNTDVQAYIDQANDEIGAAQSRFPIQSSELNTLWESTGTQLTLEQQARTVCFPPVPIPRDDTLSRFPTTQYSFVDSIPRYALKTQPHMDAQTIEAITQWCGTGGQSIIAMMRQERNQAVLAISGIPLDNSIPTDVPTDTPADPPAGLAVIGCDGNVATPMTPIPVGVYTPEDNTFIPFSSGPSIDPLAPSDGYPSPGEGYPGSLGGSPYVGDIPPNIDTNLTSSQLIPSTVTPAQAIGEVTVNNCDCWTQP